MVDLGTVYHSSTAREGMVLMKWLPWGKKEEFGDLFEQQVDLAVQIDSNLVFSGLSQDAHHVVEFKMPTDEEDRSVFIIERKVRGDSRRDQHLFVIKESMMGETQIDWYHWTPEFTNGKPFYISKLDNQKGAHEVTRILGKHWDFSKQL